MTRIPLVRVAPLLALGLGLLGCTETITIVHTPDAGPPIDASEPGPVGPHCEVTPGAAWQALGSPLSATRGLDGLSTLIAMHDGVVAVASREAVFTTDGTRWVELGVEGFPSAMPLTAITSFRGTWWIAVATADASSVFSWSEALGRWETHGTPDSSAPWTPQLVPIGDALVAHTTSGLFVLDAGETDTWRALTFDGGWPADVVATDRFVYVAVRGETDAVLRSTDLVTWEPIPFDSGVQPWDLVAGPNMLLANDAFGSGDTAYLRLDEDDAEPRLRRVDFGESRMPIPTFVGEDGTAVALGAGNTVSFAPSVEGPWRTVSGLSLETESTGTNTILRMASDGSTIVFPTRISDGIRIRRTDDAGASFRDAAESVHPARILEPISDGHTFLTRVRGDEGEGRLFALESGDAWVELTDRLPTAFGYPLGFDGLSGLEGVLVTRTSEYGQTPPHASWDGGHTWTSLDLLFPDYATNAGGALRRTSSFALDPEGHIWAATVGGTTDICCTGSKVSWEYRTGSGVWRWADFWSPMNAGIPIESPPDGFGGPPFRSDVTSIVWTRAGMFASLAGRSVYALSAGRWTPSGVGLPIDFSGALLAIEGTVLAWSPAGLYVLEDGVWLPQDTAALTGVATEHDLVVSATATGVHSSSDRGETWTELPALEGITGLALTRDRLYATTSDDLHHAIAVTCTEAP